MAQSRIYIRSLDALAKHPPSVMADYLKGSASKVAPLLFRNTETLTEDFSALLHILRHGEDNDKTTFQNFVLEQLKAHDQSLFPKKQTKRETRSNATTIPVHSPPAARKSLREIFSLRNLVGASLATATAAGSIALYLSHNDETERQSMLQGLMQVSENVVHVSSRFALAAYDQGQQALTSAEQYLEEIGHAYTTSQSIIQEQYSGSLYNPFIAIRMADNPEYRDYIRTTTEAALTYENLNPVWFTNQMYRECRQFDEDVINGTELSSAGAIGCAQFMPATAAEIGFTVEEMSDFETAINVSAYYMSELTDKHDGDQILAMIEYNGGASAIDFIAENTQGELTGELAIGFLQQRRENDPNGVRSAWHHETLGYVEVIVYGEETYEHRELARRQQLGGLPPNMIFAGALIAEQSGMISQQQRHVLQTPLEGDSGPYIDLPTRPRPRPLHIARPEA